MKRTTPRRYDRHGLTTLKRAVRDLGARVIDRRTRPGRALAEWKRELIDALGGPDVVTPQQRTIIDVAAVTKWLHDSITPWLAEQAEHGMLINRSRRTLIAVAKDRQALADSLVKNMAMLGLERRSKPVQDLQSYIAEKYGAPANGGAREHVERQPVVDEEPRKDERDA